MSKSFFIVKYKIAQLNGWVFYCSIILLLSACTNKKADIDNMISEDNVKMDKADGVTFIYSEHGKVVARLYAQHFERNEKIKPVYMDLKDGLYVEFFNDSLKVDNTLSAKTARYYEEAGNVLIRDSVVVVNKKGEELKTDELVWNQKLKKFYTEKPVSIKTATQIMYGDGLEAPEDFSWYEITNVRGTVLVDKQQMP